MKELEDYNWFPSFLRNFQTEFIGFAVLKLKVYDVFIRHLRTLPLPEQPMFGLCSGSGEPAITIFRKSNCFTHLYLSDKYPNPTDTGDPKISYLSQNIDVLEMEFQPDTCYTMFNAFHHFKDEDKLNIVEKIHKSGSKAFFIEILEPHIDIFLKVLISTTVGHLVIAPFIKPFSWKRLFFTYIIPLNILTITFDWVVSVFKSRSKNQYDSLFLHYGSDIKIFKLKNGFSPLVVIQVQQLE